jgi:hypothetical protein
MGVFGRIFVELAKDGGDPNEIMMDATHLRAHQKTTSLYRKRHSSPACRTHEGRIKLETARCLRQRGATAQPVSGHKPGQRLHRRGLMYQMHQLYGGSQNDSLQHQSCATFCRWQTFAYRSQLFMKQKGLTYFPTLLPPNRLPTRYRRTETGPKTSSRDPGTRIHRPNSPHARPNAINRKGSSKMRKTS